MITEHFKLRDYQILARRPDSPAFWMNIDAAAQFLYKNHIISMSTAGLSRGERTHPVYVFKSDNDYQVVAKDGFRTVQEAIEWVDRQADIEPDGKNLVSNAIFNDIIESAVHQESIYATAFRQYLLDKNITYEDFNACVKKYLDERPIIPPKKFIAMLANINMTADDFNMVMFAFRTVPE